MNWNALWRKAYRNSLFRQASVYTVGSIINAAIPFFLLPILTRYLLPEDYGLLAMMSVLVGIYLPFMTINLDGFVGVGYFHSREDFFSLVSTCCFMLVGMTIVASGWTCVFADCISKLSNFPKDWLWAIIVLCFGNSFVAIFQSIQQMQRHARQFVLVQVFQTLMNFILSLVFVVCLSMNWHGRVLAQVVTSMVVAFFSMVFLYRWNLLRWTFSFNYMRNGMSFGIPLIPHALFGWLVMASDRLFISNMSNLDELGIFSVGYSLSSIIEILLVSFNKAYFPWILEHLKNIESNVYDNRTFIVKFSYVCMTSFFVLALVYSYFSPCFFSYFLGEKFQSAAKFILPLSFAFAINSIYYLTANFFFFKSKTSFLALITVSGGVLHVGLSYIMIERTGAIGAAYAMVVANFIMAIATWWLSNKVYPMPWKIWKV